MKYLSLKKEVQKWWMSIEHISMSVNIADPFMKGYHQRHLWSMLKKSVLGIANRRFELWIASAYYLTLHFDQLFWILKFLSCINVYIYMWMNEFDRNSLFKDIMGPLR